MKPQKFIMKETKVTKRKKQLKKILDGLFASINLVELKCQGKVEISRKW